MVDDNIPGLNSLRGTRHMDPTSSTSFTLLMTGFVLFFLAIVGSLIVYIMPLFERHANEIIFYIMLPGGMIGAILIGVAKHQERRTHDSFHSDP